MEKSSYNIGGGAGLLMLFILKLLFVELVVDAAVLPRAGGSWTLLLKNAGIASMHSAVTHYGNVVFLDRTNIGPSQINGSRCRNNPNDLVQKHDCSAHSVLFTPGKTSGSVRPLFIQTDTWCSSGQFLPDGTLLQTGGDFDGLYKVRRFTPCPSSGNCDWEELTDPWLKNGRWYATNQLLPDGRQIVVGGRGVFTYEFIPPTKPTDNPIYLPLLKQTQSQQNDNLYPFVYLLPDGNLFIFANRESIIYNYKTAAVVKTLPQIPGEPRNYPSAGSSVMLPLTAADGFKNVEVLVCGGAQPNCFMNPSAFPTASQTCGRIIITSANPKWSMEKMPMPRTMGDMLFLANGDVIIINGALNGCQGWGNAKNAALYPVVYRPAAAAARRFVTMNPSAIARVYRSTANLLPDGRVLLAGSNTHHFYTFSGSFPTELRVDAFSPTYLDPYYDALRPAVSSVPQKIVYGKQFTVFVTVKTLKGFGVNLISSPFTTHSYSQGLRFVRLAVQTKAVTGGYWLTATAPPNANVAPPAYYMLFVENYGIPSSAAWVQLAYK